MRGEKCGTLFNQATAPLSSWLMAAERVRYPTDTAGRGRVPARARNAMHAMRMDAGQRFFMGVWSSRVEVNLCFWPGRRLFNIEDFCFIRNLHITPSHDSEHCRLAHQMDPEGE